MTDMHKREDRIKGKIRSKCDEEIQAETSLLRERKDHFPELDYFIGLLAAGTDSALIAERVRKPVVALMCLQAPLELFHAYGVHPYKIFGGSQVTPRLSAPSLPAVMCPMLRSALGALQLDSAADAAPGGKGGYAAWVIPTTCDWVVKFPEMMENCGYAIQKPIHRLELPHMKDRPESQSRWLDEIYNLRDFLGGLTGKKKVHRKVVAASMTVYQAAWHAFSLLTDLKREGKVPGVWYAVLSNAFFFDDVENWTRSLLAVLPKFKEFSSKGTNVFLAGSPLFFPNLKMMHLLEDAGLNVVMDDLCSSERLFPGALYYDDPSDHGLLKAMAQRYHQGCLCPTFADNDRRVNNIISTTHKALYKGVVFHVLKGCHPFDLESMSLERHLKKEGLKFIKLETDYTAEDSQNLLTRLEAYRSTLA